MSTDRELDRIVRSWLDEGVTVLPDRVLVAVLDRVHTTPQRRPWWPARRFPSMNTFRMVAVGVVLAATVGTIGTLALFAGPRGGIGGPSPSPTPSPASSSASPTPSAQQLCANGLGCDAPASAPPLPTLDATLISPSYGYRIRYPAAWTVTDGIGPWPLGTTRYPGNPVSDVIVTPSGRDRMRFSGASIALPRGMTMEQFRAFASPFSSPFQSDPCTPVAPLPVPLMISEKASPGASARPVEAVVSINGCNALAELGGSIYDVEVIAGGRGYTFSLDGHLSTADALAWLASIELDPASATTKSAAPSASASK